MTALFLTCCFLAFPTQGGGKSDLDLLQGTWKTSTLIVNGQEVPSDRIQDEIVTITGNERVLKKGGKLMAKATFVLSPGTNPKGVDFTFTEGDYKGKTLKGVYKFEGDTLVINVDLGQERPSDFSSELNSSRMLQKFKRMPTR